MGISRFRGEVLNDTRESWAMSGHNSRPLGTCTTPPGAETYAYFDNTTGEEQTHWKYREMNDVVTPNFSKLVKAGRIINNPMTKSVTTILSQNVPICIKFMIQKWGCTPARWYDWQSCTVEGTKGFTTFAQNEPYGVKPDIDVDRLRDLAVSSAFARRDRAEMLVLATLKEMDTSVMGLAWILKKVYKIHKHVRHKEWKLLKKELSFKEMGEIYMNARYNLRPLYYDAKGLLKVFEYDPDKKQSDRMTFRGGADERKTTSVDTAVHVLPYNYFKVTAGIHKYVSREVRARAGVLCSVDPATVMQLLGVGSIMQTVWDLTPYSFILDWFINMGDIISAHAPVPGVKALASWVTTVDTTVYSSTVDNFSIAIYHGGYHLIDTGTTVGTGYGITKIVEETNRLPNPENPVFPSWDLRLDPAKLLDLALIVKNIKAC